MPALIQNKKVYFDYEVLEKFEAGIELFGFEVKSLKANHGSITGARVLVRGNEAFVVNMDIPAFQSHNAPSTYEPDRTRRLLLNRKELSYLAGKSQQRGLTIVPISVYTKGRLIKMEIGLVKGKKKFDKRETIKKRETERNIEREMKR
ncbi:MAG: SsrA-binding protein SmpB [Parcubacteria group bacterium]|nr:SsrA-binding protein SmpB [Parcubacteria group bacterium]MCR4342823.1 SsrA-binding protein SmpB [Patescibacteria group bacterium]